MQAGVYGHVSRVSHVFSHLKDLKYHRFKSSSPLPEAHLRSSSLRKAHSHGEVLPFRVFGPQGRPEAPGPLRRSDWPYSMQEQ